MIKLHVDVVLGVRDGFTGAALPPSAVMCTVDGYRFSPVRKDDGTLVFEGLGAGVHDLLLQANKYRDERLSVVCTGCNLTELLITLKPGKDYPFGSRVTSLTLRLKKGKESAPGAKLWVAAATPEGEVRIAQETAEAGADEFRLFYKGQSSRLGLPRNFLIADGDSSEICRLETLESEVGLLFVPLRKSHKRSRSMYPAQLYTADGDGLIRAVFREPVKLLLFNEENGKTGEAQLSAGENSVDFSM